MKMKINASGITTHPGFIIACVLMLFMYNTSAQAPITIEAQDDALRSFADPIVKVPVLNGDTGLVSWEVYERMGNRFVSSYLLGSSDATPTRSYAALESAEQLSFGYNMAFQKGKEQWRGMLTLGLKADISKGFAPVYSADKGLRENLGGQLKFTFIGNPALQFDREHRVPMENYMKYKKTMLLNEAARWIEEDAKARSDKSALSIEDRGKEAKKKREELEEKLTTAIIDQLESKKLFNGIWNWWVTLDAYIPFAETKVMVADSATQTIPLSTVTYPLTAEARFFIARKASDGRSILGTIGLSLLNNNSALAQQLKTVPFVSSFGRAGSDTLQTTVINSEDVYVVKNYQRFLSPAIEIGLVVAPSACHPLVRFRASVQQFLYTAGNEYTPTIWIVGLPFTLLDKDKKPTVNLEPQVRLQNGVSTWGLSVGVPLGDWIN